MSTNDQVKQELADLEERFRTALPKLADHAPGRIGAGEIRGAKNIMSEIVNISRSLTCERRPPNAQVS